MEERSPSKQCCLGLGSSWACSVYHCVPGSLCPRNSPGKNIGVGCHFLLQAIFPTQGSYVYLCIWCLLHWQMDFLPLAPPGNPHTMSKFYLFKFNSMYLTNKGKNGKRGKKPPNLKLSRQFQLYIPLNEHEYSRVHCKMRMWVFIGFASNGPLKAWTFHCPKYNSRNLTYSFQYKIFLKCSQRLYFIWCSTEETILHFKAGGKPTLSELLRNTVSVFEVTTSWGVFQCNV